MGPKNNKKMPKYPFVSICTPTFNRRPFIPIIIKCFENQDYPKDKMEWIIVDDGTDKIEDLVKPILHHLEEVVRGKKDLWFLLSWFANIIQNPHKKPMWLF